MVELSLQDLVREVDAELLEAVRGHDLEPEDIQDTNERARTPGPVLAPRPARSIKHNVDFPVDPSEQLSIDVLYEGRKVLLRLFEVEESMAPGEGGGTKGRRRQLTYRFAGIVDRVAGVPGT